MDVITAHGSAAEVLHLGASTMELLLDAAATNGALTVHRTRLGQGDLGASPHLHRESSEMFYVLSGTAQVLSGEAVVAAGEGDVVVVPPHAPHAFGAARGSVAELLVVLTPGIDRFELFRTLCRVAAGTTSRAEFVASQPQYDTYAAPSVTWDAARAAS